MPQFSRRLLLFAAALAAVAGMAAWFWAVTPTHADEALEVERGPALNPQESPPYAAKITAIRFSSDRLYEGDATIYVDVRNDSSRGEATFRVILEIVPPGGGSTETLDLGTMAFGAKGETKTFEKEYDFEETNEYSIKAKVYSPSKDRMFYEESTTTSVHAVTYDAKVTNISVSPNPVQEGTSTIEVEVENRSPTVGDDKGAATFDIRLTIDPPGAGNTVHVHWNDVSFSAEGDETLTLDHTFKHDGNYELTAEVYDNGGLAYNWPNSRRFDDATREERFQVDEPYDVEVTDIDVDPDPVQNGSSTISVEVENLSATNGPFQGRATFDIRLAIDPPGAGNTVHVHWNDVSFSAGGDETLTLDHTFKHNGNYELTAEVYDNGGLAYNWPNSRRFDDATREERFQVDEPYDAEVTDIDVDPDPVQNGSSTISVEVENLSATNGPFQGRATFDIRLAIDPLGAGNTVHVHWNDVSFSAEGDETLTLDHTFKHDGNYELTAEVYDNGGLAYNWPNSRRFDDATREERFQVDEPYDAEVTDIDVDPDPVQNGSSTISVEVENLSAINGPDKGAATFDIRLTIDPPGSGNTVHKHWNDVSFSAGGDETLSLDHTFKHDGNYELTAEVYDNGGLANGWPNSRRFDDATREERFQVDEPYAAQVTDIRISPSPLRVGEATISVDVLNQSSLNGPHDGAATFDVRLEVDPPLSGNTEHPADNDDDWDNVSFAANETVTLSKTYPFTQATGTFTRYRLKAEVYGINGRENDWHSDHLFSDATGTENFEVADLPDLAVEIREQVTPVVGKPLTVPLILKNKGSSTSPEYSIRVAIGKPAGNLPLSEASSLVPSGNEATAGPLMRANLTADRDRTFPNITSELSPGGHLLCVLIEYAGGEEDKDGSDNADCRAVYVLPDMGREFPGELQAFLHLDDHIQHRIDVDIDLKRHPAINIASKLLSGDELKAEDLVADRGIAGTMGLGVLGGLGGVTRVKGDIGTGSEPFWVFVPTEYSTRYEDGELKEEIEELGKEVVERTWGGLESRANRENSYQKLALEIARRGQTYGNKFVSVGVTEEDKKEFVNAVETLTNAGIDELPERAETLLEYGDKVVDAAIVVEAALSKLNVNFEHVDLNVVHGHLDSLPLHKVNNGLLVAKITVKTVGLANDIRITESLNRSIFVGQATKTLELLAELEVDDAAWSAAIVKAQKKLAKMTSNEGLQSWSAAIEENLPNIAATYSQIALQAVAAKLIAVGVGAALTAAGIVGFPVAVIAVPVTIAVAFAIDEIYEIVEESDKFWDGITLASMSTQIYSHVFTTLSDDAHGEGDLVALKEISDYLEFAYYKHLARSAESNPDFAGVDIGVLGDGRLTHNKLQDNREAVFHERDEILSEVLGGDWDHTKDFKFLEDAHRPLAIWSDGTTMWVMDGESANDYIVHAFDLSRKTPDEDKKLEFHPYSAFVDESFSDLWGADAGPRGIWGTDGTLWIADHDYRDVTKVFGYKIDDESKIFELPSESQGFSLPSAGLWSDGTTMWFSSWTSDCGIVAYDVETPSLDIKKNICELAETNKRPYGLWSDGKTMWVSDVDEGRIFAYSVRTGDQAAGVPGWEEREILREIVTVKVIDVTEDDYPHIANNSAPTGIWSDGETMWVADRESDRIFAYTLPDSLSAPLNLTADAVGDSRIDLDWDVPSDTGRAPVTGYVVQESEDGINWTTISSNTTRTGYSRTGLSDWGVRYYRVAAINRVGAGPFSNSAVAHQGFSIDSISCTPEEFYVLETVQCSAIIGGIEIPGYSYLWEAKDGTAVVVTSTEDGSGGNKASATWDTPGPKLLRVVACRTGNPTEYINTTLADVGPATIDVGQASAGACAERTQTILVPDLVPSIYFKNPSPSALPESIGVGDSFDLEFRVGRPTWVGGPGGITVSFPDLTDNNTVSSANSYNSDQGRVRTVNLDQGQVSNVDSATTFADVTYLGNSASQHLSVSAKTGDWPSPPSIPQRTLRLRIQPEEAGEFRVRVRYWLCNEERTDEDGNPYCARYPKQDDTDNPERDQQGWATYEFTVTVVPKPEIDDLGCDSDTVDIGTTVTCSPTYEGGDIDSYRWRAGYEVAGGDPSSGSDANFATKWGFSGMQTVELRVCNDISGCTSDSKSITVNPDLTEIEDEEMMPEEMEEEEPDDGGRVLISGLASEWAHSSYSPTDTTIQVRALPTADMPTLEFTLSDEDGFAPAAGDYVSPGALVLALPDDVWVDYDGISAEMLVESTWVDFTAELEKTLLALETISGGQQRTALTAQGLAPASVDGSLTPPDLLAWGLGETGQAPLDDLFGAKHANCVVHVTVPWLALAAQTTAFRVSIPADVSTDDYISLALAAITAEGENGKEAALVQAHDLLDTGDATPGCEAP